MPDPLKETAGLIESATATLGAHPKVFVISLAAFGMAWALYEFAKKDEVADISDTIVSEVEVLKDGLEALDVAVDRQFLLQDIAMLEHEIYAIESLIANGEDLPRDRDRLVLLRGELNEKRRQLGLLEK